MIPTLLSATVLHQVRVCSGAKEGEGEGEFPIIYMCVNSLVLISTMM